MLGAIKEGKMNIATTIKQPTKQELKARATKLLKRYDNLRAELREVERELAMACTDYGRSNGLWGFNKDHMRLELDREQG